MIRGTMFVGLTLVLCSTAAQARDFTGAADGIAHLKELYFMGRYDEALPVSDDLVQRDDLTLAQRIEVLELQAFVLLLLKLSDQAKASWQDILILDPSHEVDPDRMSPEFVAFFGRIEPPPRNDKVPVSPVEESVRESALDETLAPSPRPCGIALCLVPFGVGQYANGRPVKGAVFTTLAVGFLATNIGMYWSRAHEINTVGYYQDPAWAETRLTVQRVAFGLFATTLVVGVLDAFLFP